MGRARNSRTASNTDEANSVDPVSTITKPSRVSANDSRVSRETPTNGEQATDQRRPHCRSQGRTKFQAQFLRRRPKWDLKAARPRLDPQRRRQQTKTLPPPPSLTCWIGGQVCVAPLEVWDATSCSAAVPSCQFTSTSCYVQLRK
jgi:hypothetical protein